MEDSAFDEAFEERSSEPIVIQEEEEDSITFPPLGLGEQQFLYNGHITEEVSIGGKKISIRTLKIGEELEAAMLADKYKETVEAGRALITALVAAAIVSIDGRPLIAEPLGPDDETLEARFRYVKDNWYWPPIQHIYNVYGGLVKESQETFEALKKD